MPVAARRHGLLVRAPAELGGLHAFGYEAFDRPGVDEGPVRLGIARALGIAFGDVDAFDAGAPHELRPAVAGAGRLGRDAQIPHDVEQRVLHHPGHHAGIGAAAAHRRDAARPPAPQLQHAFAQRIVRARRRRQAAVGIEARPRLDHRIDVERVDVLGELHQLDRRGVDRQIHDQSASRPGREQGREQVAIVRLGQRHMDESDLPLVQERAVLVVGRDHHELGAIEGDVPLDQRQRALADRAEADHHDRAVEACVHRPDLGRMCDRAHVCHSRVRGQKAQAARAARIVSWRGRRGDAPSGRVHQPARAFKCGRDQLPRQQPIAGIGAGQGERAGLVRREPEAAVIGCIAHQQDGLMTTLLRRFERMLHQLGPDAAAAEIGGDRERSQEQRRPTAAGRDAPQPHRADQPSLRAGDERQSLRRQSLLTQPLGRLGEAAIAESRIEQRLAPRDIERGLVTNGDHGRTLSAFPECVDDGRRSPAAGNAGSRARIRGLALRCGRSAAARSR